MTNRQINYLVATKVLGLTWNEAQCGMWRPLPLSVPNYVGDLALAFEIVNHMDSNGWHFLLMMSHESKLAIASFYHGHEDRSDLSATEMRDFIPRAICRAALRACGVLVPLIEESVYA